MDFPFTQPICSHDDASDAMHAVHWWRAHSIEDGHEIADRVIEIAAFRSTQLWLDTQGAGVCLFTPEPIFVSQSHDEMLLAPATHHSGLAALSPHPHDQAGTRFFDNANCFNLLGSQLVGELFRRIMGTRFGLPACNDPAVSAQVRPLRHTPQRVSSCPAPDVDAGGCRTGSNRRRPGWRVADFRSGAGARTAP